MTNTTNTERLVEALKIAADTLGEAATYTSSESWSPSMTEAVWLAERVCRAALAEAESAPRDNERWSASNANSGHGHVHPRPDGSKARCGGPAFCAACELDLAEAEWQAVPSAWWSLVMGAAASLEEASMSLRDADARKQALGAAVHYRQAAKKLYAAAPEAPAPTACRTDGRCQYAIDHGAEGMAACPQGKCVMPEAPPAPREPLTVDEVRARFDLPFISDAKAARISELLAAHGIGTDREGG